MKNRIFLKWNIFERKYYNYKMGKKQALFSPNYYRNLKLHKTLNEYTL